MGDVLPAGIHRLVLTEAINTKADHLIALFHLWLLETGFEKVEIDGQPFIQTNHYSGRMEVQYTMLGCHLRLQLLPIASALVVRAFLGMPDGGKTIVLPMNGNILLGDVVTKTYGPSFKRFFREGVRPAKVRFKNAICLAAKRTLYNELGHDHDTDSIQALPAEMVLMVASYLSRRDRLSLSAVNRRFWSVLDVTLTKETT